MQYRLIAGGGALIGFFALTAAFTGHLPSGGTASRDSHIPEVTVSPGQAIGQGLTSREYLTQGDALRAAQAGLVPSNTKTLLLEESSFAHGDYTWDERGAEDGALMVWVDLRRQMVSVFRGGHEIGTAVAAFGAPDYQSPVGTFDIISKHEDYHSRTYDAPMPYSLFITADGVALHASPMGSDRATHGCIGLPEEFARLLFEASALGDKVTIVRSSATLDATE